MRVVCSGAVALIIVAAISVPLAGQHRPDRVGLAVGPHFTIAFEGPEEETLAARALESLDRSYWRIGGVLNTYPPAPVAVVLYTAEEFHDITRAPPWAAAAYDDAIRIPMRGALSKDDELDRVLAHEFAHALIHTLARRGVPMWLNEGLATALERESIDWARARIARAGGPLALERLTGSFSHLSAGDAEVAYATSTVAAARLLNDAGGVAVSNLLRDLGAGAAFDPAFTRRTQRRFADFVASLGGIH